MPCLHKTSSKFNKMSTRVSQNSVKSFWNKNMFMATLSWANIKLLPPLHNSDRCSTCWCSEKNHGLIFQSPALLCFLEMEAHLERSNHHNTLCMKMPLFFVNAYWSIKGGCIVKSAIYFQMVQYKIYICIYIKLPIVN